MENFSDVDNKLAGENDLYFPTIRYGILILLLHLLLQILMGMVAGIIGGIFGIFQLGIFEFIAFYVFTPLLSGILLIKFCLTKIDGGWQAIKDKVEIENKEYLALIILVIGSTLLESSILDTLTFFNLIELPKFLLEVYQYNYWALLLVVGILIPIIEEIIYRGVMLRGFLSRYKPVTAITVSAFFFAVIHFNIYQGIAAFIFGVVIGWVYYKTKSLKLAIIAHSVANIVAVTYGKMFFAPGQEIPEVSTTLIVIFLGVGILLIALGRKILIHNSDR